MSELNPKQKRFCDEYLVDHNAKQAAIRSGYTKKTAEQQGSRLLSYAKVKAYLAIKAQKIEQKLEISAERTLLEIARLAYTPATAFYDKEGRLLPINELGADAAACLAGFDIEELWGFDGSLDGKSQIGELKKVKRFDKNRALEMLAKHFKLFIDAPAPAININLGNLSAEDLKNLLAIKKKMDGA